MNARTPLRIVIAALLLPALSFAAGGKTRKRPAADTAPKVPEVLKTFDKNGNHQIDSDELADLQKTFSELRKLDKNSNGELEVAEVTPPPPASSPGRGERAIAALKKIDKNGNHKIDADEIESLQRMLAGGQIMKRLDQNGDGKLDPKEVERLNQRLAQGGLHGRGKGPGNKTTPSLSTPKPSQESKDATKPEAKPDESKKDLKKESPGDLSKDPFLPTPEKKAPANSENKA